MKSIFVFSISSPRAGNDLHRQSHANVAGAFRWNIDVSFQIRVLVNRGQQGLRGNVVADVNGNVTDDSVERRSQVVVRQLALLGDARGLARLPSPPWSCRKPARPVRKLCLLVTPSSYSCCWRSSSRLVVIEDRFLLRFGAALLIDGRLLLQRIDGHQRLPGADVIARLDQDAGERAIHLRLNGRRAARLYRRHILICLRHRSQGDSLYLTGSACGEEPASLPYYCSPNEPAGLLRLEPQAKLATPCSSSHPPKSL